jgi:hypothetical protein
MTIDAVRIRYIIPNENENQLDSHNHIALPLDNEFVKIQLPDKE